MKFIVIIFSLVLGIIVGYIPHFKKGKNIKFKIGTIIFLGIAFFLTIFPPLASDLKDGVNLLKNKTEENIVVACKIKVADNDTIDNSDFLVLQDLKDTNYSLTIYYEKFQLKNFTINDIFLLELIKEENKYYLKKAVEQNPSYYFPYIPALGNYIRLMNFHVPMAWIAVLAFFLSMLYSIFYLRTKNFENDIIASSSAFWGVIFCILATISGMIWAKINWGAYWNWDPRQTSIFILLLIYFAYFSLRTAIENKEVKARLSAVYSILAFVTVPFLVFLLPRFAEGLHPGSGSDFNSGPLLSANEGMMNESLLWAFSASLFAITMLFFWLLGDRVKKKIKALNN